MHHAGGERPLELGEDEEGCRPSADQGRRRRFHARSPASSRRAALRRSRCRSPSTPCRWHRRRTAWSALGVMHAAVNSGWWFDAGKQSSPSIGWMLGHRERDVRHVGRPRDALRDAREAHRRTGGRASRRSRGRGGHHACRARTRCTRGQPSRRRRCSRWRVRRHRSTAAPSVRARRARGGSATGRTTDPTVS